MHYGTTEDTVNYQILHLFSRQKNCVSAIQMLPIYTSRKYNPSPHATEIPAASDDM